MFLSVMIIENIYENNKNKVIDFNLLTFNFTNEFFTKKFYD